MRKFWILIQEMDDFGHFAAYVRPVQTYDNIAAIIRGYTRNATANIYPTKRDAYEAARILNDQWHRRGLYRWDYMEDGVTPAPFW